MPDATPVPTTPTPADNGGQPTTQQGQPPAQPAPAATPAAATPFKAFADQAELDNFVKGAKSQAERAAIRKMAKEMGFEDVDEMRETLQALRQAQGGGSGQPTTPEAQATTTPAQGSSEVARLQMAIKVGGEMGLPIGLLEYLKGDSEEAIKASATALMGLLSSSNGGGTPPPAPPGIPPVPAGNSPVTFTRTQLSDAKFVRENQAAIRQAAAQNRIVDS